MSTHAKSIEVLRRRAEMSMAAAREATAGDPGTWVSQPVAGLVDRAVMYEAAAALLETHDATGISLDNYVGPRELVNRALRLVGRPPFIRNGV